MDNIPVFKPLLLEDEFKASNEALENGWLGMGSYVGDFESAMQEFLGAEDRHCVALSTGHAALHLGFLLSGAGPGDEIITPSFNNIADFQAIIATRAKPVFCDIDEKTLCIDLNKAKELIGPKTKAIVGMDYDCLLCDHDGLNTLAEEHGIRVMHDAAHSFGSTYQGKKVGSFSDLCMFSFDPVKTITCIDGGLLVVRSEEERRRLHEMRLIGMGQPPEVMYQNKRAWTYGVRSIGFRYHMANLHAAIGLAQLKKMDDISRTRRETCIRYNKAFAEFEEIITPQTDFADVTPFLYYVRVPADKRDDFRAELSDRGIDTGIHWQPGHSFELFQDCRRGDLSVTDKIVDEIVSLPLHSMMTDETQQRVIEAVVGFFKCE
ncbi:MAG: aminotransferase DegT [Verrucomicrobiales bacterium]|nr:aminotransferase DegT [Verrucomicrobiales bacterium]|tara:strand:- start:473 stop:1603 length:1131 start_codon:yes stop_codon:yes gene_type:complete